MACEKRVDGQMMSYPCELKAGHETNGPEFDPEPCATEEVPASIRRHAHWRAREEARATLPEETIEDITAEAEQTFAEAQVIEPEHNLRDGDCMMRPAGDAADCDEGAVCPTCSGAKRPAVLVENDEAIRAGEIHNPFDVECTKRHGDEISLDGERCYICQRYGQRAGDGDSTEEEAPTFLHEQSGIDIGPHEHEWVADGTLVAKCVHCLAPYSEPTKQREGDQVLPAGGDRAVQDWMIKQEQERYMAGFETETLPDPESGKFVIEAMTESKRVGIERYGQPLHTFDGRLNIRDLADELRDAFVYISKMQMTAEADKATLVRAVSEAIKQDGIIGSLDPVVADTVADIAVDRILDWVLIQKIGPEQVMPIRVDAEPTEWMGT